MSTNELQGRLHELKELRAFREELDAEITGIEDAIKAAMGEQEELRAGAYKVRWAWVESLRLDASALKTASPELYQRFAHPVKTRRFTVA